MKKSIALILVTLLLIINCFVVSGYALQDDKRTVRVGWFASDGVHAVDFDGTRSGYDYDFLQAISQYTNWEYEYVEGTWAECYNWLKNGDIDILGIVNKTPEREEIFDYSYTSAGTEMCCLFVSPDNKEYSYQDFKKFDGMTIAIEDGTYQSQVLNEYAAQNNFTYTTKTYPTLAEAQKSVDRGDTDALLSSNTDVISGYKAIAQFNPIPFYYATTKGNTNLLKELNYAMNELLTYYPKFSNDLYSRYYGGNSSADVVFSSDELAYIKSSPTIKVLYDPIWYPIESYNEQTHACEGIVPDLMNLISHKCGIPFLYENFDSSVEVLKVLGTHNKNTNSNLISSITYDYKWAAKNNVNITQPFIDASVMCVTKDATPHPKTVALVEIDYISEMVKSHLPKLKPIYFESMAKCIEAVKQGDVDCAYLNNYEAEYYMTMAKYRDLNFHTSDVFKQKICFGISKDADPLLFSIISKSLQSISSSDIQNLVYQNSYHVAKVTLQSFTRANPILVFGSLLIFIFVILSSILLILRNEIKHSRKIAIENERYHQLAEMTDEHIYEYCYETDFLSLNNSANKFWEGKNQISNYSKYVKENLDESEGIDNTLYSCFSEKQDLTKEINTSHFDGVKSWYRVTGKIIRDTNNQAVYAIGKIQNIQDARTEKEHLIDCANRDGMTGLYNAKSFSAFIGSALNKDSSLFIMDVDRFKSVNDNYGHYNGDLVLTSIAAALKETFGNIGIVGRLGGDEFAVFISEFKTTDQIKDLCQQLLNKVADIKIAPDAPTITMSIGVAFALPNETYVHLYKRADYLLYEVKHNSRNGYRIS